MAKLSYFSNSVCKIGCAPVPVKLNMLRVLCSPPSPSPSPLLLCVEGQTSPSTRCSNRIKIMMHVPHCAVIRDVVRNTFSCLLAATPPSHNVSQLIISACNNSSCTSALRHNTSLILPSFQRASFAPNTIYMY